MPGVFGDGWCLTEWESRVYVFPGHPWFTAPMVCPELSSSCL